MSNEDVNIEVAHDPENTKYVLTVDGKEAGAAHYINAAEGVREIGRAHV